MLTAQQAIDHLLSHAQTVTESEEVTTQAALGRVLAENVNSLVDVPPLDNTAMDGYAVRTADTHPPGAILRIAQRIPAGSIGTQLEPGTAARIFTGAPVPQGADAVVMQEDCALPEGWTEQVQINVTPVVGQWIRRKGEDLTVGKTALVAGTFLRPQELGVAASAGLTHLSVKRRVRVAAFFTGDELALPGEPLKPGGIYNSNRDTLLACLKSLGCDATDLGIVPDFDWLKADRRNEFLRVKINSKGGLDLFPNQSSGVLTSASWGDGLVDCLPGEAIRAGDMVKYIPFSALLS